MDSAEISFGGRWNLEGGTRPPYNCNYKQINNFSSQKLLFFMFFVSLFTITRPRISKIGTHDALINFYVKSKFQLSSF